MMVSKAESQAKWRANTDRRKVEAYLPAGIVEQLDRIVKQGGHRGRGEALGALICAQSESLHVENTPKRAITVKSLHVDRKFDSKRCECRTAKGGRCKLPTLAIIKKRVDNQVMEFGACKRHEHDFEPFRV
jgi:hypothetical protein